MKFSPLSVIPEQTRHTTPDTFIVDQYGKMPDIHGDGKLTINDAIRISKIINGYTPAFATNNNRIIHGFYVNRECVKISGNDLMVDIPAGIGIINKNIFKIPIKMECTWKNFLNQIPAELDEGRVLIYFAHRDIVTNYQDRPYSQSSVRKPTVELPENQVGFNPISVCRAFYDPVNKKIINSLWDPEETKVLITGSIKFRRRDTGYIDIYVDENDKESIDIIDGDRVEEYPQQGGGYYDVNVVDGGEIDENFIQDISNKFPTGINVLFDSNLNDLQEKIMIRQVIQDPNKIYVFYNGILYKKDLDWIIDARQIITFTHDVVRTGAHIYVFENVVPSDTGYLNNLFFETIKTKTKTVNVPGLKSNSKVMVFVNGLLISNSDIASIQKDKINFKNELKVNDWVNVTEIVEGITNKKNLEIIYDGYATSSSLMKIYGLNKARCYLVLYNGVLYTEDVDYTITNNAIFFKYMPMTSGNKLLILGIS